MNKVAIVTGASMGIGRAIAQLFAQNQINVVINSRSESRIRRAAQEIQKATGHFVTAIQADVTKHSEVERLVKLTLNQFGRVDILVNNAGVVLVKPLVKTTDHEFDYIINTNLKGVFYCCKAVLPYMMSEKSGHIINISSGAGKAGFEDLSLYCASKFGVIGLTQSLAKEVSKYKIKVIAVCPGAVATQMQRKFMSKQEYEKAKKFMIQPYTVANTVLDAVNDKFPSGSAVDVY